MSSQSVWQNTVNGTIRSISWREEKKTVHLILYYIKIDWKKSQISSVISDNMISVKGLKALLHCGGKIFYFRSWRNDPCIKMVQLSSADIRVQNNAPIARLFFTERALSVSLTWKGPVIPSLHVQPTPPKLCLPLLVF